MIKTLFFSLTQIAAASACAALVRAGGHRARAVDATLLTKADREAVDLVFTDADAAPIVHAAYDDKPVIVVDAFTASEFLPERMAAAEEWVRGDGEQPSFGEVRKEAAPPATELVAAELGSNGDCKTTAAELRAALTAKGVAFKSNASKTELQALLAQAS